MNSLWLHSENSTVGTNNNITTDSLVNELLQESEDCYKSDFTKSDSLVKIAYQYIQNSSGIKLETRLEAMHIIGKHLVKSNEKKRGTDTLIKCLEQKKLHFPNDTNSIMKTMIQLGNAYLWRNMDDSSYYYYDKVRKIAIDNGNWDINLFHAYLNKGIIYARKKIYDTALMFFDTVQIVVDKADLSNETEHIATFYFNYALLKTYSGKLVEAEELYRISSEYYEKLGGKDIESAAGINNNLGINNYLRFELAKARLLFKKALELYDQIGITSPDIISHIYNNLSSISLQMGNYHDAIEYCEKGLAVNPDNDLRITLYSNLAKAYGELDNYKKANTYFQRSLLLLNHDDVNPIRKQEILSQYAEFLAQNNDDDKSIMYFRMALSESARHNGTTSEQYGNHLINIGYFYLDNKHDPDSAIKYFNSALTILSSFSAENDVDNLNIINEKRIETGMAEANYLKYISSGKIEYLQIADSAYKDVLDELEEVVKKLSDNNKLLLLEMINPVYSKAVNVSFQLFNLTADQKYKYQIFDYLEHSKSSALLADVNSENALKTSDIPNHIFEEENKLKNEVNNYRLLIEKYDIIPGSEEELREYESKLLISLSKYDSLISYIEENYPKYYSAKYENPIIPIADVHENLDEDEVLIEYMLTDSMLTTILINYEDIFVRSEIIGASFFDALKNVISVKNIKLENQNKAKFYAFKADSYYLWTKLIEPVDEYIENKRLIIVPDGLLGYLPFDILIEYDFETDKINYRDLPYLIRKHPISYAYSATLRYSNYFNKRSNGGTLQNVIAIAPSYDNSYTDSGVKLKPLYKTEDEVSNIVGKYGGKSYTGPRATKQNFDRNLKNGNILHLAMHTIFNDSLPLQSKLVFYDEDKDSADNYLYTHELYNKDISASMVTLSACNTASGEFKKGEGIFSLSRGFVYAGVPSVVMTLWEVQDETGSRIMEKFYDNIFAGMQKDEALQKAKIAVLQESNMANSHPFFWSAYIINGDTSEITANNTYSDVYRTLFLIGIAIISFVIYVVLRKKKQRGEV